MIQQTLTALTARLLRGYKMWINDRRTPTLCPTPRLNVMPHVTGESPLNTRVWNRSNTRVLWVHSTNWTPIDSLAYWFPCPFFCSTSFSVLDYSHFLKLRKATRVVKPYVDRHFPAISSQTTPQPSTTLCNSSRQVGVSSRLISKLD